MDLQAARLLTMSNFVGHQGKNGCCMQCPLKGCCKPGTFQYYSILLKPNNYDIPGCTHDDINIFNIGPSTSAQYVQQLCYLLQAHNWKEYQDHHLETGIVDPSILLGLQLHLLLGIPGCFLSEMMHLSGANMASKSIMHCLSMHSWTPSAIPDQPCAVICSWSLWGMVVSWIDWFSLSPIRVGDVQVGLVAPK